MLTARRVPTPSSHERTLKRDAEPLPDKLTTHSLRRTFASLLYAVGEGPSYVMAQMGHTRPNPALAIYARAMDRRDGERSAVIYRKLSLGSQSGRGERRIERLLSAHTTCRLQRRSLFAYLSELLVAHARGDPVPLLA